MTLEAIKEAIAELPADERNALAAWLTAQDSDEWDRQMAKDFSSGWSWSCASRQSKGRSTRREVQADRRQTFAKALDCVLRFPRLGRLLEPLRRPSRGHPETSRQAVRSLSRKSISPLFTVEAGGRGMERSRQPRVSSTGLPREERLLLVLDRVSQGLRETGQVITPPPPIPHISRVPIRSRRAGEEML